MAQRAEAEASRRILITGGRRGIASTIVRQMKNPMPMPLALVVYNASKMRAPMSPAMPRPLSSSRGLMLVY